MPPNQMSASRQQWDVTKLILAGYELELIDDNKNDFYVTFHGPKGTAYESGVWRVHVTLPGDYPFASPSIGFVNKILHPNIDEASGTVCLDVINQTWTPLYSLVNVFDIFLPQLLTYPNAADPLNADAGSFLLRDKEGYELKIREYVRQYASCEQYSKQKSEEQELSEIGGLEHDRSQRDNVVSSSSSSSSSSSASSSSLSAAGSCSSASSSSDSAPAISDSSGEDDSRVHLHTNRTAAPLTENTLSVEGQDCSLLVISYSSGEENVGDISSGSLNPASYPRPTSEIESQRHDQHPCYEAVYPERDSARGMCSMSFQLEDDDDEDHANITQDGISTCATAGTGTAERRSIGTSSESRGSTECCFLSSGRHLNGSFREDAVGSGSGSFSADSAQSDSFDDAHQHRVHESDAVLHCQTVSPVSHAGSKLGSDFHQQMGNSSASQNIRVTLAPRCSAKRSAVLPLASGSAVAEGVEARAYGGDGVAGRGPSLAEEPNTPLSEVSLTDVVPNADEDDLLDYDDDNEGDHEVENKRDNNRSLRCGVGLNLRHPCPRTSRSNRGLYGQKSRWLLPTGWSTLSRKSGS